MIAPRRAARMLRSMMAKSWTLSRLHYRCRGIRLAGRPEEERNPETPERHGSGRGVPRETEHRVTAVSPRDPPEADRATGPHLHTPEVLLEAHLIQDPLHEVGFTHRRAPDRDEYVGVGSPPQVLE